MEDQRFYLKNVHVYTLGKMSVNASILNDSQEIEPNVSVFSLCRL